MVGPVWREPEQGTIDNFSAVWADDPGFDPRAIMRWTAKLHRWMSDFFGDESAPPYRVFMRFNPMNAGGGAALYHSDRKSVVSGTGVYVRVDLGGGGSFKTK